MIKPSKKRKYSSIDEPEQSSNEQVRVLEKRIHQLQQEIAGYKEKLEQFEQPKSDYSSNYIS